MQFPKGYHRDKPKGAVSIGTRIKTMCLKKHGEDFVKELNRLKNGTARDKKQFCDYILALLPKNTELTGADGTSLPAAITVIYGANKPNREPNRLLPEPAQ